MDIIFAGTDADRVLQLHGRSRDIYTGLGLDTEIVGKAEVKAALEADHRLAEIETSPSARTLATLLGSVVGPGFRGAVHAALGAERGIDDAMYQLLDDLPVAALISGYATLYRPPTTSVTTAVPRGLQGSSDATRMLKADICAGWSSDATMMRALNAYGEMPVPLGPPAPLLDESDPIAWHDIPPLGPNCMRRRRMIDVTAGNPLHVYAMFRDTHTDPDGGETVLHEYSLNATLDPETSLITACKATPRSLPWTECPAAAQSSHRVEGSTPDKLRSFVGSEMKGTSTCTHLNDLLRSLGGLTALLKVVRRRAH